MKVRVSTIGNVQEEKTTAVLMFSSRGGWQSNLRKQVSGRKPRKPASIFYFPLGPVVPRQSIWVAQPDSTLLCYVGSTCTTSAGVSTTKKKIGLVKRPRPPKQDSLLTLGAAFREAVPAASWLTSRPKEPSGRRSRSRGTRQVPRTWPERKDPTRDTLLVGDAPVYQNRLLFGKLGDEACGRGSKGFSQGLGWKVLEFWGFGCRPLGLQMFFLSLQLVQSRVQSPTYGLEVLSTCMLSDIGSQKWL